MGYISWEFEFAVTKDVDIKSRITISEIGDE